MSAVAGCPLSGVPLYRSGPNMPEDVAIVPKDAFAKCSNSMRDAMGPRVGALCTM